MIALSMPGPHHIATVTRIDGGFTNRVFRVAPADGSHPMVLRMFSGQRAAFEKERALLKYLKPALPVPEIIHTRGDDHGPPCLIYRWIEGVTLNTCRRREPAAVFDSLGEGLGRLLALVATFPVEKLPPVVRQTLSTASASVTVVVDRTISRLGQGRARTRLGEAVADAAIAHLERGRARLSLLDRDTLLVHGDFGGRNILVAPIAGTWRPTGLIDWENASLGTPLWDIGTLFRYTHRFSTRFRADFARGFHAAGGTLPPDWWGVARLLDATVVVGILESTDDLEEVERECRALIEVFSRDDASSTPSPSPLNT